MRLTEQPILPDGPVTTYDRRLSLRLFELVKAINIKVNALALGRVSGTDGAMTSPPAAGEWAQGDWVRNAAPTEAGSAGSRYVVTGWMCVAAGSPGTWVQTRVLTGA